MSVNDLIEAENSYPTACFDPSIHNIFHFLAIFNFFLPPLLATHFIGVSHIVVPTIYHICLIFVALLFILKFTPLKCGLHMDPSSFRQCCVIFKFHSIKPWCDIQLLLLLLSIVPNLPQIYDIFFNQSSFFHENLVAAACTLDVVCTHLLLVHGHLGECCWRPR